MSKIRADRLICGKVAATAFFMSMAISGFADTWYYK